MPRASGEKTEQHERVVIPVGRARAALGPLGPARDIDPQHVIGGGDALITGRLCRLNKIPQRRRLAANIDNR